MPPKEQTIDTYNNLDESQENSDCKKVNPKKLHIVWFHLYNIWNGDILEIENRFMVSRN